MSRPRHDQRRSSTKKLEPIDWHEFANDAVLNGNMSTLFHRPPAEDPSAYASAEALAEIRKRRGSRTAPESTAARTTVGLSEPTVGQRPTVGAATVVETRPVGTVPTVGSDAPSDQQRIQTATSETPTVGLIPTVGMAAVGDGVTAAGCGGHIGGLRPTVGGIPTVGTGQPRRIKPVRAVQDALTLAGQVLYRAMYGMPDGSLSKTCTKGYRQLAAETHLDKDTIRDLLSEFKEKGIIRQIGTYDPDTRSAKTYEVLSDKAILANWHNAGIEYVTAGRGRPVFCTSTGVPMDPRPTVGILASDTP